MIASGVTFYICVFLVAAILALAAERNLIRRNRLAAIAASVGAVAIPALAAGARDISVGTDTGGYVSRVFTTTITSGGSVEEVSSAFDDHYELGYLLLAQIGRAVPDIHLFLFAVSAAACTAALAALVLFDSRRFALGYLVYLIMHFNESLNMSRQSISLALGMLAAAAILRNRRLLAAVSIFTAVLFHSSAVLLLLYLPIYWATEWRRSTRANRPSLSRLARAVLLLTVVALCVFAVVRFESFAGLALESVGLKSRYDFYLEGTGTAVPWIVLLCTGTLVGIMVVQRNRYSGGYFIALALFCGGALLLLTGVSEYLWRVSGYFLSLIALGASGLCTRSPDAGQTKPSNPWLLRWAFLGMVVTLWGLQIVAWNNHETLPYTSTVLGIG